MVVDKGGGVQKPDSHSVLWEDLVHRFGLTRLTLTVIEIASAMPSVRRSETRRFPLGRLKFPQSFPTFENLLPLYGNFGNFPKIHEIEQNLMRIST